MAPNSNFVSNNLPRLFSSIYPNLCCFPASRLRRTSAPSFRESRRGQVRYPRLTSPRPLFVLTESYLAFPSNRIITAGDPARVRRFAQFLDPLPRHFEVLSARGL